LLWYAAHLVWINWWTHTLYLAVWLGDLILSLGLRNDDMIGQWLLGTSLTRWIPVQHDFNFNAENALSQLDVLDGALHIVVDWVTRVDHEAVDELHGLGTLTAQLTRHDDLATLGARLHDKTKNTVASSANWKTAEQLVLQRLSLSNGTETTSTDLLGVQLDCVVVKVKALLHDGGELANASALLAQDLLGLGGQDNDLSAGGRDTHLDTTVAVFGELLGEELVKFGLEDTAIDKFSLL